MYKNYILRQKNDNIICFYYENNTIYYKIFQNSKWCNEKIFATNVLDNFTAMFSPSGEIYVFCQGKDGNILLHTVKNILDSSITTINLQIDLNSIHNILFYPIIKDNSIFIIYNVPKDDNSFKLKSAILDKYGNLSEISTIEDSLYKSNFNLFQVQYVTNKHLLAFYHTRPNDSNIGYKEITEYNTSNFINIHQTNYQIIDYSFLTTDNTIHVLYAVKTMFSYQLIYKKKEYEEFEAPIILWDGAKISDCLLSIINNNIHVFFICKDKLYTCISKNKGMNFTKPDIYKNKFCVEPKKAVYISESNMSCNKFFIREVLIDKYNPCDIQLLPDLCEDFYKIPAIPISIEKQNVEIKSKNISNNNANNNFKTQINKLKNEISKKDEQIEYMTNILNKYKSKKDDFEFEKVNADKRHSMEIKELKDKISFLEKEKNEIKTTNKENYNNENSILTSQISDLQNEKNNLISNIEILKNENLNLENEINVLKDNIKSLELKLQNLNNKEIISLDIDTENITSNVSIENDKNNIENTIVTTQSNKKVLIPYKN